MIKTLVRLAIGLVALAQVASAEEILLNSFNYRLRANTPYETGLYRVQGAPAQVDEIILKQRGTYCDLEIGRVDYQSERNGQLRSAVSRGGATYTVAGGVVDAVNVQFTQRRWTNVTCELLIYGRRGSGGGGGEGPEVLIGAINYRGGFVSDATVAVPEWVRAVQGFRLAVPAFCQGVEVLSAGTVERGVFFRAQPDRNVRGGFVVGAMGSFADEIRAALNGPLTASCDIPVYVR